MRKHAYLNASALLPIAAILSITGASAANAQTPDPVNPDRDACQAPADQRDPNGTCPPADSPSGEAIAQGAVTDVENQGVTVVGSRIRRDRFNTADPVTVINRQAAVDAGFNSTAELLQSVGVTGGTSQITDTFGGLVVDGGPGVNTLSLRGLGPSRTLILLNGRRLSPAGTRGQVSSVDLNVLPDAILDRIEVLNTGASSVYGSDAIAGVVNVVTLSKFNGIAAEASISAPQIGAGTSQRYALTAGTSGERFSILGSIEMFNRNTVRHADLKWARCPRQLRRGPLDVDDTDKCWPLDGGGVTVNTIGTGFVPVGDSADIASGLDVPGGSYLYCTRWRPNGSTAGVLPGFECVGGFLYNPTEGTFTGTSGNVRDTFAPAHLQQDIIPPTRNYTAFVSGTYDTGLFGEGQLYAEFLATRRKSQQRGQSQSILDYPEDSPLLTDDLRAVQGVLGAGTGIRVFADGGLYKSKQRVDYVKLSGGFRGELPFLPAWRYDLYGAKSWTDSTYSFDGILEDRLINSFNVVENDDGTFSCAVPVGGCVAAPVLTDQIIAGQARTVAPQWWDYIFGSPTGTTKFREVTTNLTFDGPLFRLPGGDAQAVIGFEYRKSRIHDEPSDDMQRDNILNFTSAPVTRGSDSVKEVYGEVELPVLRNVPFADALTLNASARYTDYRSYGSGTTYKVGGLYSPTRWLSLRGSYGTSYRAPALSEQFLGSTSGFAANTIDPCNELFDVNDSNTIERCESEGLPPTFIQNNSVAVIQRGGAETGLESETSSNLTFGFVLQPSFGPEIGNLSLAVDYFRVRVKNGVSQLSEGTIASDCYDGSHPEYCQFITRDPYTGPGTGGLTIVTSYINIAKDNVKGLDFTLRYDRELGPGKLEIGAQAVRMFDATRQTSPDVDPYDYVGTIGQPKWSGTGHVGYDIGPWYFRWGVDYIQGTDDGDLAFAIDDERYLPEAFNFRLKDYWLNSASVRFEPSNRYSLTLGVRNVFDQRPLKITAEDPNINQIANVPLQAGFDMRGRTFFVNAQAKLF
jgi:outer membrane receptor protein involved in Fe transport